MKKQSEPRAARRLAWQGSIDIQRVAQLKEEVQSALEAADAVAVDLHEVTGIDLAGLQLLCSAKRSATGTGKRFEVSGGMSNDLHRTLQLVGMGGTGGCGKYCDQGCLWNLDQKTPEQ